MCGISAIPSVGVTSGHVACQNQMHLPVTPPLQLWKSLPWGPKDDAHRKGSGHLGPSSYSYILPSSLKLALTHFTYLQWCSYPCLPIATYLYEIYELVPPSHPASYRPTFKVYGLLSETCQPSLQLFADPSLSGWATEQAGHYRHPKKHEEKEMFQWPKPDAHTKKHRVLQCELHGKSRTALDMPELWCKYSGYTSLILLLHSRSALPTATAAAWPPWHAKRLDRGSVPNAVF